MEKCGFFDANLNEEEYDRVYLAAQFARYFASFIGNGVYAQHGDQLQVMAQSTPAMSVQVLDGQGWINGYWYENSDSLNLSVDVADGVLNRIDSIVLRLGFSERNMWLAIKKGTPAATPVAPALTRSADYYELQLATISIPAGSIKITQAQITDTRMNKSVCGWVTGVVDQIDTTTLFSQFEAYLEEFKANNEAEFASWTEEQRAAYLAWIATQESDFDTWYNAHTVAWQNQFTTWFQTIKDQLGEDVAGQLQNQINVLEDKLNGKATTALYALTLLSTGWTGDAVPYAQEVTVTDITAADTPLVDIVQTGTEATDEPMREAWGVVTRIVAGVGKVTAYASEKPTVDVPIQLKVVRNNG